MNYLRLALLVVAASLLLIPAMAQSPASAPAPPNDGQIMQWMRGELVPPIANLPFTAKVELETVNQIPDGTFITHKTYNIDARDSLGRTRVEARRWITQDAAGEPQLLRVLLYDPATRTRNVVFPLFRTVRRWMQAAPFPGELNNAALPKAATSREDLGADNMEGLPVRGARLTQIYELGALGNNRSLTIVTENWYSDDLKINLLTKRTDPRFGAQTVRVTELVRGEPEASLFAVPEDYRVVNETLAQESADEGFGFSNSDAPLLSGVARAGVNGVGIPACVYCPTPQYTDKARAAKLSGSVVLQALVTVDGRAENISIVKGHELGLGLDESAIHTVAEWRFKPAMGPDGKPVAVTVPLEVTFRIK
jgi:TonB family protein